jgi:hypothetical protein
MNAPRKSVEFDPAEARFSARDDLARLPLIAPQLMIINGIAGYLDLPRPANRDEAVPDIRPAERDVARPDRPSKSRLGRMFAAVGRRLSRPSRPYYLSEHLCRDIGLEWMPPDPPPRFWTW